MKINEKMDMKRPEIFFIYKRLYWKPKDDNSKLNFSILRPQEVEILCKRHRFLSRIQIVYLRYGLSCLLSNATSEQYLCLSDNDDVKALHSSVLFGLMTRLAFHLSSPEEGREDAIKKKKVKWTNANLQDLSWRPFPNYSMSTEWPLFSFKNRYLIQFKN